MNTSYTLMLKCTPFSVFKNVLGVNSLLRSFSTRTNLIERQNSLFNLEKKRQRELVGRVEKIEVNYVGLPEQVQLVMNKGISTPYDCARHINENITKRSAVALINENTLWHMHRPLPDSCTLDFLHFTMAQPAAANKVFWRTCSFLLGATVCNAFKDKINVQLHSFPSPNVRSGSFVYDVELGLDNWLPTQDEMRVLSIEMLKIIQKNLPLEYLQVSKDLALDVFKENPHKFGQIPDIALHNEDKITLYRAGDHIDISKGPMLSNTGLIGRCTVAAVHKLNHSGAEHLYRFQGVALPRDIYLNHFAYNILEERARNLNSARIPGQESLTEERPSSNQIAV